MKKVVSLFLVIAVCLTLFACGKKQEQTAALKENDEQIKTDGQYTIDDLIGVWHSEECREVLSISPDMASRRSFSPNSSSFDDRDYKMEIDGNIVSYSKLGKFQIEQVNGILKLACIETGKIAKGTNFVKVESIIAKEDLNGNWYSLTTGNAMEIVNGKVHMNNKQKTIYHESQWDVVGDTLYIDSFLALKIVVDGDSIKLVDNSEEFVHMSADETQTTGFPTDKRIDFSVPILLFEDNDIRLEVMAFYQEVQKDWDSPATHKDYITIRFHNKADYEIMCFPDQFYIGNEKVKWVYVEGTPDILPGKVANYSFNVKNSNDESLDSMDVLYQLNGRFEVFRYENNRLSNRYYASFSFDEASK